MKKESDLRVVSYNILSPCFAEAWNIPEGTSRNAEGKLVSNWNQRSKKIIKNLKKSHFDIACLQEVTPETGKLLSRHFNCAAIFMHFDDPADRSYGNAIFYNPNSLQFLSSFAADSQSHPGRRATGAVFLDRDTSARITVMSAHLKHFDYKTSTTERTVKAACGLRELDRYLSVIDTFSRSASAVIIAGDFNEDPDQDDLGTMSRHALIRSRGFIPDQQTLCTRDERKLDWIYSDSRSEIAMLPLRWPHPDASDHLPTSTIVKVHARDFGSFLDRPKGL